MNKKAGIEIFDLLFPIVLFMVFCTVYYIIFSYVSAVNEVGYSSGTIFSGETKVASSDSRFHYPGISSLSLLRSRLPSSEFENYGVSIYDIFYYNMESKNLDKLSLVMAGLYNTGCNHGNMLLCPEKKTFYTEFPSRHLAFVNENNGQYEGAMKQTCIVGPVPLSDGIEIRDKTFYLVLYPC